MKKIIEKTFQGPLSPVFKVYRKIYKPVVLHFSILLLINFSHLQKSKSEKGCFY